MRRLSAQPRETCKVERQRLEDVSSLAARSELNSYARSSEMLARDRDQSLKT